MPCGRLKCVFSSVCTLTFASCVCVASDSHLFIIYGHMCLWERTPSSQSQWVLVFNASMCSTNQHNRANHANTSPTSPARYMPTNVSVCVCVCVCVYFSVCPKLRGRYLFRLCGSIIRISSTCYPGLCVCVCVCVCVAELCECLAQICLQVFLRVSGQQGGLWSW